MKKFKAILKDIGIGAGVFLGFFVAAFLVLFLGVNIFYEKNLIPAHIALIIIFAERSQQEQQLLFFISLKEKRTNISFSRPSAQKLFFSYSCFKGL